MRPAKFKSTPSAGLLAEQSINHNFIIKETLNCQTMKNCGIWLLVKKPYCDQPVKGEVPWERDNWGRLEKDSLDAFLLISLEHHLG